MKSLKESLREKLANKKGVAGLDLALEIIIFLFIIGLLTMIFVFLGSELRDQIDDNSSKAVINDTTTALASVTDWFGITITMGFIVVLILLTVIIVRNIRGKGGLTSG